MVSLLFVGLLISWDDNNGNEGANGESESAFTSYVMTDQDIKLIALLT